MQEIALVLSSLAGIATAAAVRRIPRHGPRLLSMGASSHIKSQVSSLEVEKDILAKTITRLYQSEAEYPGIHRAKLLARYQHQLGIVLAKLEKLEQASRHPDLGPVGDGLITLMDQKLSKMDDRLYEISSRIAAAGAAPTGKPTGAGGASATGGTGKEAPPKATVDAKKPGAEKAPGRPAPASEAGARAPAAKAAQSVELTTLTRLPGKAGPPTFEELPGKAAKPERPASVQRPARPAAARPAPARQEAKAVAGQRAASGAPAAPAGSGRPGVSGGRPDIDREVARVNRHKALPGPQATEPPLDDDFDDGSDDLAKIKDDIAKALSRIDQAEVE